MLRHNIEPLGRRRTSHILATRKKSRNETKENYKAVIEGFKTHFLPPNAIQS